MVKLLLQNWSKIKHRAQIFFVLFWYLMSIYGFYFLFYFNVGPGHFSWTPSNPTFQSSYTSYNYKFPLTIWRQLGYIHLVTNKTLKAVTRFARLACIYYILWSKKLIRSPIHAISCFVLKLFFLYRGLQQ